MGNLNKVQLIGRLGRTPEKRITKAGKSVVSIGLATSEYYKDQSGNRQERTEWHRLNFWERTADVVEKYCKKGSQIFVEGSLRTRKYEGRDGTEKQVTEITVRNLQLLDAPRQSSSQQGQYQDRNENNNTHQTPPAAKSNNQSDFIEDDIPF
jgi:single-strand DNA-binding protein